MGFLITNNLPQVQSGGSSSPSSPTMFFNVIPSFKEYSIVPTYNNSTEITCEIPVLGMITTANQVDE